MTIVFVIVKPKKMQKVNEVTFILESFQDNLQATLTNVSTNIAVVKFQQNVKSRWYCHASIHEKAARTQNFSEAETKGLVFSEHLCGVLPFTIKCDKCIYFVDVAVVVGGDDQDESHSI